MRAVDIIAKKRDGGALGPEEIAFVIHGITSGVLPDYQASALLMAIVLRGMSAAETAVLTGEMVRSGARLDLAGIPGVKVDKHSTGGVGDKTSLIVAPLAAACGVLVPMMSGRGLGHTGGTLDKLESIPGLRVHLSLEEIRASLIRTGCVMAGQTHEIAPADRTLYALRDVTATVESIPLIAASIMSKKIAEGIDALVLDVKAGSGAFMKTDADAGHLAASLVALGRASGIRTEAVITRMSSPLGRAIGNALEVAECLDVLKGGGAADLVELSIELAARMLVAGGVARDRADGARQARAAIASGAALDRFRRVIEGQGGDARIVDDAGRLPHVAGRHVVTAPGAGYVRALDAERLGRAAVALGAGRDRVGDEIDPGVGIVVLAPLGTPVQAGDGVLELHVREGRGLDRAIDLATHAVAVSDTPPRPVRLIVGDVP